MSEATARLVDDLPRKDPKQSLITMGVWGSIILLLILSWDGADIRPIDLYNSSDNMAEFIADFLKPNFHQWPTYFEEMVITVEIAIWGTALAIVTSIPFGILSSDNIAPWWVVQPVRRLMDAFRAINELVFALIFIVAVGLGPFAGVLALWVHTTGVLAKLMSEAVEAIDPQPVEGIRATGASRAQEVIFGVIPQVLPLWISFSLYRFESNVRSATVLGLIGAGGIGQNLTEAMRGFAYDEASAILIIVIVSVTVIDFISQRLRKMVI